MDGMITWHNIQSFIHKVKVENVSEHEDQLLQFEKDVGDLYNYGKHSFLTKDVCGDQETFYFHCLRFYLPKIAHHTWTKHKMGIGIFTMQGFERRNKESKNCMKRFSNRRGNIIVPNLKRLWDVFYYGKNAF